MININARLRRMGNSLGIIVPSHFINKSGFKEGEELVVSMQNKQKTRVRDILREAFKRKLKFRRTTEEILDEIDEDSD